MKKMLLYAGIFGLGMLMNFMYSSYANAWTAHVEFSAPSDPTYLTDVLVSEISGDYSQAYGQRSLPGDTTVDIGNIKPSTTYYFIAYRLIPDTWERSPNSLEVEHTTPANIEPVIHSLPPIPVGDVVLNITIAVE